MYASLRWHWTDPGRNDEVLDWIREDFAPRVVELPGLVIYRGLDLGSGELLFLSVFESAQSARKVNDMAVRESRERWSGFAIGDPRTEEGQVAIDVPGSRVGWMQGSLFEPRIGTVGYASCRCHRFDEEVVPQVLAWVEEEFVANLRELPGFDSYHGVDLGGGQLFFMSAYGTREAAEEANTLALEASRSRWREHELGEPEVDLGSLIMEFGPDAR